MDLDGFIAANRAAWDRLDALVARAGRRPERLAAAEVDELVRLYLRASSHLSTARTQLRDPALLVELSTLVARANAVVYGTRSRTLGGLRRFATRTFPAAVWHDRRPILAAAALFLGAALVMGAWVGRSDAALAALGPSEDVAAYVDEEFEAYYSAQPAPEFATLVFTNNAQVAVLAFGVGIAACLPTVLVLVANGLHVGVAGGVFVQAGELGRFLGLLLPHGLLELTAIFVAGGAGIRLGWSWIAPGDRWRTQALADAGRRSVVLVIGLVVVFLVAGVLEAFVTPAPLPTPLRVGTGAAVWLAFCAYVVVLGRIAAAEGYTGAIGEESAALGAAQRVPPGRVRPADHEGGHPPATTAPSP